MKLLPTMNRVRRSATFAATLLITLSGCAGGVPLALEYALHAATNQFDVQANVEPIDEVLASERLDPNDASKLELAVRARDYAASMGLAAGASYTTFYDTAGNPLAWNLSAAHRDRLEALTWTFPIIGTVPYLAFFEEDYLRQVEADLEAEGFDTMTYELDAYSTLGVFDDPIRSPMLNRNVLSLSDTIIHELLHNTIWRPNDTTFNESLATFVGRRGAVEFLVLEYGVDSGWPELARSYYSDLDVVNAFLADFFIELETYYAEPLSPDELIAGREAVFQGARDRFTAEVLPELNLPDTFRGYGNIPSNNAWILANNRYNLDLQVFEDVFTQVGEQWPAALQVFADAARAGGDPFDYLRNWLATR